MEIGLKGYKEIVVNESMLASNMGSGYVQALSTPTLIACMEAAAASSMAGVLGEECTTVGIRVEISHLAPTPLGAKVRCESELLDIDGKILTFQVDAYDEVEKIGQGQHQRAIVNGEKFQEKTMEKLKNG